MSELNNMLKEFSDTNLAYSSKDNTVDIGEMYSYAAYFADELRRLQRYLPELDKLLELHYHTDLEDRAHSMQCKLLKYKPQ